MKKLFECADQYVKECDWRDLAMLKFCLCAMGIMAGLCVPEEKKKGPFWAAAVVFVATYIPLMAKFAGVAKRMFCPKQMAACTPEGDA